MLDHSLLENVLNRPRASATNRVAVRLRVCWLLVLVACLHAGCVLRAQSAVPAAQDAAAEAAHAQMLRRAARRKAAAAARLEAAAMLAQQANQAAQEAANEKAARAPVVTLDHGILEVEANGAALNRIVQMIAALGGTRLDGEVGDAETFGSYGPAAPGEVLTELLAGSDQNVVMLGVNSKGAPLQLIVTPRSGEPSPSTEPAAGTGNDAQSGTVETLGPGASVNVPPPPPDDQKVRMQQNLDRLQKMQDEQKQGQAAPPPPAF